MTDTITEQTVEIIEAMDEPQFRHVVETILGRPRQRFKSWAEYYVFELDPATHQVSELTRYLRDEPLSHRLTTERTWRA